MFDATAEGQKIINTGVGGHLKDYIGLRNM